MNKIINVLIVLLLLGSCIFNVVLVSDLNKKTTELIELTDIEPQIIFLDSIEYDTVYITKTEIVKLPIYNTDTLVTTDTIVTVDSVFVEVPISTYHYDTTLAETHISLICEGFNVRLDTLLVESMKVPIIEQKVPKKWYENFGIGLGIGATYCDGLKILPTIGIYYKLL